MGTSVAQCIECKETKVIAGRGLCYTCYRRDQRNKEHQQADDKWSKPADDKKERQNRKATRKALMRIFDGLEELEEKSDGRVPASTIEMLQKALEPEIRRLHLSLVQKIAAGGSSDQEQEELNQEPAQEQETNDGMPNLRQAVIEALIGQGFNRSEAVLAVDNARGNDFGSLFQSALATRARAVAPTIEVVNDKTDKNTFTVHITDDAKVSEQSEPVSERVVEPGEQVNKENANGKFTGQVSENSNSDERSEQTHEQTSESGGLKVNDRVRWMHKDWKHRDGQIVSINDDGTVDVFFWPKETIKGVPVEELSKIKSIPSPPGETLWVGDRLIFNGQICRITEVYDEDRTMDLAPCNGDPLYSHITVEDAFRYATTPWPGPKNEATKPEKKKRTKRPKVGWRAKYKGQDCEITSILPGGKKGTEIVGLKVVNSGESYSGIYLKELRYVTPPEEAVV